MVSYYCLFLSSTLGFDEEKDDTCPPATDALVLMVVSLTGSWKLAIGHFFIATLFAEDKALLIKTALQKLSDVKVKTVSVTCDCLGTNWSTLKKLGASFDLDNLKCFIPHPNDLEQVVQVIFDPSHLIKLVRNTLSDFGALLDSQNNAIR